MFKKSVSFYIALSAVTDLLLLTPTGAHANALRIKADSPDAVSVWVFFTDKPTDGTAAAATSRALARRRAAGFSAPGNTADAPVNAQYLREVERQGGILRHAYKWDNAASFDLPVNKLREIAAYPYIRSITPVGQSKTTVPIAISTAPAKKQSGSPGIYGNMFDQLEPLFIPEAHDYLALRFPGIEPGSGVRIALFDSGFRLKHRSLRHLSTGNAVVASYDFVDRDTSVEDPDSVAKNPDHPYFENDLHGSMVASLFAAYDPPYFCGSAWGADFLLARTEDAFTYDRFTLRQREIHGEEDNWAAAVVWAESLGVDIISSSVAYRTGFEDTILIEQVDGTVDTLVDYRKSDLDGATSVISRAAREAVKRGVVIVNSAGNDGELGDTSLNAPADVDGVVAVGATDRYGYIADFSSRGPTADGRTKPDLVALGNGVAFPDFYDDESTGSYMLSNGTSFSAPLVAGICALMKQSDPTLDAAHLREKLYRSCRFLRHQTNIDNSYGHGIPDALLSCMRSGDLILSAIDTGSHPLSGALITAANGDSLAVTDNSGRCQFRLRPVNATSFIVKNGSRQRRVSVSATPDRIVLRPCSLTITVVDNRQQPIPLPSFDYSVDSVRYTVQGDSDGRLSIVDFFQQSISGIIAKEGYLPSDTLRVLLDEPLRQQTVRLSSSTRPVVSVFPTVIRRSRGDALHIKLRIPATGKSRQLTASVRTITGERIWNRQQHGIFSVYDEVWTCRTPHGERIAPGTYFVVVVCDNQKWRKKILVTP